LGQSGGWIVLPSRLEKLISINFPFQFSKSNHVNMKALVISGGGSKGAFAGGVAEYLMKTGQLFH